MMRPSDQAKLLFLYLLRSSAALATRSTTASSTTSTTISTTTSSTTAAAAAAGTTIKPLSQSSSNLQGHINLRLATRLDVPSIQRCNLATLPENYSSNFYVNHMRSFPDLALVAEHVPPGAVSSANDRSRSGNNNYNNNSNNTRRNPFESYNPSSSSSSSSGSQIIGYVLGKIDQPLTNTDMAPPPPPVPNFAPSRISTGTGYEELDEYLHQANQQQQQQQQQKEKENVGHVTSLAVLKPFRRKGLAAMLMKQLHVHMKYEHRATKVGLHVRVSNVAARRLYCEGMGYGVVDVIQGYYADGEDAFFMVKNLNLLGESGEEYSYYSENGAQDDGSTAARGNSFANRWSLNRRKHRATIYKNGPLEFRLPMMIPLDDGINSISDAPAMVDESSGEEDAHLMTGSL